MSKFFVTSVSWPDDDLHARAKARANALGLSMSAYIRELVVKDLNFGERATTQEVLSGRLAEAIVRELQTMTPEAVASIVQVSRQEPSVEPRSRQKPAPPVQARKKP